MPPLEVLEPNWSVTVFARSCLNKPKVAHRLSRGMKTIRTAVNIICLLAAAGLTVGLTVERQACFKLAQENNAFRQQLSQMDEVVADGQRLSNLLAQADASPSRIGEERPRNASGADERTQELVQLRGEVETLRQQSKEVENLRADTRQVRAAQESGLKTQTIIHVAAIYNPADGSQFEILKAEYWTGKTNMDVAPELRDRIRGGSLKAIASNNIKGDPDFGQMKRLTIVYRSGGVMMTNEFREGDYVALPQE
jgi:hypothetical protein